MNISPDRDSLYHEYSGRVAAYIGSRVSSREDAEDLCQEVFMKVYSSAESYDSSKAGVSTWIFTITRNTVIDYLRSKKETSELPEELADESTLTDRTFEALADAVSGLPREQRDIIVLRYYNGLTLKDIAALMGISYGMVKLRHKNALDFLKASLAK